MLLVKIGFCCTFLLLSCQKLTAQGYKGDLNEPLTDAEIKQIRAPRNSTFTCLALADSFSNAGDSINAGNYFLQIDPYYFLFAGFTVDSINDCMLRKFKLTKKARESYAARYDQFLRSRKSAAFDSFKKMETEDQLLRFRLDSCKDSACFSLMSKITRRTDSIHFRFLYRYIIKNGWPSIANGSLYASVLAIHDHDHAEAYIPLLKKAVLEGQAEAYSLRYVNYWYQEKRKYDYLDEYIRQGRFRVFEVSSLAHNVVPPLNEIEKEMSAHCPENTFLVCKCRSFDKFWGWILTMYATNMHVNALALITAEIDKYNCSIDADRLQWIKDNGMWRVDRRPADNEELQVYLYITFDEEDTAIRIFNKFIKDKKLITHPIHFEENKTAIAPEDIDFLNLLVKWLEQNPLTKLELDGHTDKEGTAASNAKLSLARANEVKKKLVASGIDADRFIIKGFGDTMPLQSNDTPEGKAANRRVEFIILKE